MRCNNIRHGDDSGPASGCMHRMFQVILPSLKAIICLTPLLTLFATAACGQPTLDDLWDGKARLKMVGELNYGALHPDGAPISSSGWYSVSAGTWYAFSRVVPANKPAGCGRDVTQVVVNESKDQGKTWSRSVVAAVPGSSSAGDACAILDGSSFYDQQSNTWHMLAQCLGRDDEGGWSLCHYTRKSKSPLGKFSADPANPVVRGGQLWSSICGKEKTSCKAKVFDEGTPDIVEKRGDRYVVTMHGFDGTHGYRTVVSTPDFRNWSTSGSDLPGEAILTVSECNNWLKGCVGFGQATSVRSGKHVYVLAEAMNRSLLCSENQNWTFALLRSRAGEWPRSGGNGWEQFRQTPLLRPSQPNPKTMCQIAYAHWIVDGQETYLTYEDWEPGRKKLHRVLLKLIEGGGSPVELK